MLWYMGSADDDGEWVDSGTSALALAAGGGHDDCVALLLAAGATAVDVSPEGVTSPLRAAVENWHSSTVEQLTSVVDQLQPMPGLCDLDPELVAALSDEDDPLHEMAVEAKEWRDEAVDVLQHASRWQRRRPLALVREQRAAARDEAMARRVWVHGEVGF